MKSSQSAHRSLLACCQKFLFVAYASMLSALLPLHAQTTENKQTLFGIGTASILDTYLSPEEYKGISVCVLSIHERQKADSPWTRQTLWAFHVTKASNRANNADILGGHLDFQYDWLRSVPCSYVNLKAGPSAGATAGGLYNTRNGNNPAQLLANADASITVAADRGLQLFHKDLHISYYASLPLFGAAFSPQYGQSYYEIFTQGNYDHNIILNTPLHALSLRHILTVDIPIRNHHLRVGYLGDYRQREANSLKHHHYAHELLLGYSL